MKVISQTRIKFIALVQSSFFNSIVVGLFILGLVYISFFPAVKAFVNPQCSDWLTGVTQLVAFLFAVVIFNKDEVRKHTWKFLLAILTGLGVGRYIPPLLHPSLSNEKEKIQVWCNYQENKIVIDMSALSESKRNELAQVSIVAEDNQTHLISIFRILQLQGQPTIIHQFTDNEIILLNRTDWLQLRFARRFSLETAFILQVKCLTKIL